MGPLELGARGRGGAARAAQAALSTAAHRLCVRDRRAEAPWQRAAHRAALSERRRRPE